jgi:hypothetical protein
MAALHLGASLGCLVSAGNPGAQRKWRTQSRIGKRASTLQRNLHRAAIESALHHRSTLNHSGRHEAGNVAEYLLTRNLLNGPRSFAIRMLREEGDIRRIDGMY